jgi:tetratricopeptide (TPR) repeat protein
MNWNKTAILGWGILAILLAGCGGKVSESKQDEAAQLPEGHPPLTGEAAPGSRLGSDGPTDDHALPLKATGLNSAEELDRALAGTENTEARAAMEDGYRKTFTANSELRDYPGAIDDLERAIALDPNYAEAHRALGYAQFNMGFNVDAADSEYQKAVALKPDYGEAHYALAFLYAMNDLDRGAEHYKKAMALGVEDERNLGERFYPGK